jgi:hypothetical protein
MFLETTALSGRPCLVAKSSWGSIGAAWLAPYSDLCPTVIQMRGQGVLPGVILSRLAGLGGDALLGDTQPPALDTCGGVDCLDTCIIDFDTEHIDFYQGLHTSCWNYYGAYTCIPDRVTIIDSDGTGPRTRVYAIRRAWAHVDMP